MSERLPVPSELNHLIEKRAAASRRKKKTPSRRTTDRRKVDLGPLGSLETAADLNEAVLEERRKGGDRRKTERRAKTRRKADKK